MTLCNRVSPSPGGKCLPLIGPLAQMPSSPPVQSSSGPGAKGARKYVLLSLLLCWVGVGGGRHSFNTKMLIDMGVNEESLEKHTWVCRASNAWAAAKGQEKEGKPDPAVTCFANVGQSVGRDRLQVFPLKP